MTRSIRTIVGVDTGGTFTDFVFLKDREWGVYKVLSTPDDPSRAVLQGLEHMGGCSGRAVVHGSTVATNAILEQKGARTALVVNQGFEDIIEIGRQNRSGLYDLFYRKPPPIVPRSLRLGIPGRMDSRGREVQPLDLYGFEQAVAGLVSSGVESVAVCFLFSYLNPSHEKQILTELEKAGFHVSLSHQVLPEFRELERLCTTVVNAYVSPGMSGYLERIRNFVLPGPLRIMQSNGGSISVETAMLEPVRTILSGPAGGVAGALELGRAAGFDRIITFDMGGTSTDVCLIDQILPLTMESTVAGYPLRVPMLDIHTVGAGGGSLAGIDPGGALKVGPESAGADPGPICYGKGDKITVTDANLFLGRLIPSAFLGGTMTLDTQRLKPAFEEMGSRAGLDPVELARGILSVINANMERAVRVISVERGHDPREFTLFSFGGAGGLHCAYLASLLSIPRVLIPKNPGILSAMGMVMADVIRDYSLTVMLGQNEFSPERLEILFRPMEHKALEEMKQEGFDAGDTVLNRFLDMRYKGQSFEIMVPFSRDVKTGFSELHHQKYGYSSADREVEVVNLRIRALGSPPKPSLERLPRGGPDPDSEALLGTSRIFFQGKQAETRLLDRERLRPGNIVLGPAIVLEYSSTLVVPPFAKGTVDEWGNIVLSV